MTIQDYNIVERFGAKYREFENIYSDFLTYTDYTNQIRKFKSYLKELSKIDDGDKLLTVLRAAIKYAQKRRQEPIEHGAMENEIFTIPGFLNSEAKQTDKVYKIANHNSMIGKNIITDEFDVLADRKTKEELIAAYRKWWSFQEIKHRMVLEHFTDIVTTPKGKLPPTNETAKKMKEKGAENEKYRKEIIEIAANIIGDKDIGEFITDGGNVNTMLYKNPKITNHKKSGNARRWLNKAYQHGELSNKVREIRKLTTS